jgi:hypothetical protein
MKWNLLLKFLSFVLFTVCFDSSAHACASCGSGGSEPLVLAPNHSWRFYLGVKRSFGFQTVQQDGNLGSENAPKFKDAVTVALGKSLSESTFYTFSVPYLQNWKSGSYKRAFGDANISFRHTALQQNFSNPYIPQIQFVAAHKFANAPTLYDSEDQNALDIFGNGIAETKLGTDVYFGMQNFKFGLAQFLLLASEASLGDVNLKPGMGFNSIFTLGYGLPKLGKVLLGYTRLTREKIRLNGKKIDNSEVVDNGVFFTTDIEIWDWFQIRSTWNRSSAFLKNKNGSRSDSIIFAGLWALPE